MTTLFDSDFFTPQVKERDVFEIQWVEMLCGLEDPKLLLIGRSVAYAKKALRILYTLGIRVTFLILIVRVGFQFKPDTDFRPDICLLRKFIKLSVSYFLRRFR